MTAKKANSKKTCFVIGPIGAEGTPIRTHADWLLEGIILPVFEKEFVDFDVLRSDRITTPGMIDSQMINLLIDAELVIADMSLLNANAFYEMGIRHMAQKPIIHMFLKGSEIPFDVKPYRAIPFDVSHPRELTGAQSALAGAVSDVLAPGHAVDNPVTKAVGEARFQQTATPIEQIMREEMQELRTRIHQVENNQQSNDRENWSSRLTRVTMTHTEPAENYASFLIYLVPEISESERSYEEAIEEISTQVGAFGMLANISRWDDRETIGVQMTSVNTKALRKYFSDSPIVERYAKTI